jgi:hypothetical protein
MLRVYFHGLFGTIDASMITLRMKIIGHRPGLAEESVFEKYRQSHGQSTAKVARQLQGQRGIASLKAFWDGCCAWTTESVVPLI